MSAISDKLLGLIAPLRALFAHPQVRDWSRLVALGVASFFSQRLLTVAIRWLQYVFCITSVHHLTDESFDWLMGESRHV
jgi:hypothetical protein